MGELSISVGDGPNPSVQVAALSGEMDESNLEALRSKLDPVLNDAGVSILIFDLAHLNFINSKGIGYLVSVHTHLAKNKRRLILVAAKEAVMDVINLVGLTTIIPYFATLEEANQSIG